MERDSSDEDVLSGRMKELRRSGLILDDDNVQQAWEEGNEKLYIPIRMRYGKPVTDSIADVEKLGILNRHIEKTLKEMAAGLRRGSIAADPYYKGQQENACLNCDYFEACHFSDGANGESCRYTPKLTADQVWQKIEEVETNG